MSEPAHEPALVDAEAGESEGPVSRLAQLRAIPLGQRRANPWAAGTSGRHGSGIGAILDALGGEDQPPPSPLLPPARQSATPATPPYANAASARVEEDWLVVPGHSGLHFAPLDIHQLTEIQDNEMVTIDEVPLALACGARATTSVSLPGIGSRRGALRCGGCCAALSYPRGTGSPKNDPRCRLPLQARLDRLP